MSIDIVLPSDISLEPQGKYIHAFTGFFGKYEMDSVARLIVTLCAVENEWREFTYQEILLEGANNPDKVSEDYACEGFELLEDYGWIEKVYGLTYRVKKNFIQRCKEKSDLRKAPA